MRLARVKRFEHGRPAKFYELAHFRRIEIGSREGDPITHHLENRDLTVCNGMNTVLPKVKLSALKLAMLDLSARSKIGDKCTVQRSIPTLKSIFLLHQWQIAQARLGQNTSSNRAAVERHTPMPAPKLCAFQANDKFWLCLWFEISHVDNKCTIFSCIKFKIA